MLRGPAFLRNMIVATTPIAGGLVAIIIFILRNAFSLWDVWLFAHGFLVLLRLPFPEEFSEFVFPLGPFFFTSA